MEASAVSQEAVRLEQKIARGEAVVGTLGLGYVGLPLSVEFASAGLRVTGFDLDRAKVEALNRGESYVQDVPPERVDLIRAGRQPRLALVTCYPFGYVGSAPYRMVVHARPAGSRAPQR